MTAAAVARARPLSSSERVAPLAASSRLPRFTAPLCRLLRVVARSTVGRFQYGESTWRFRWILAAQAAVDLRIRIRAGAAQLLIGLPRAQATAFPADAFDARVPAAIRTELLAEAGASLWKLLAQLLGVPVQPLDAGALGAASSSPGLRRGALAFALEEEGQAGGIVGLVKPENDAAVRLLTEASAALIARDDAPIDAPIELHFVIGTARIDATEARGLEQGDTILLKHRAGPSRGLLAAVRAGCGAHAVALVECRGHGVRVLETWLEEVRTMDEPTNRHDTRTQASSCSTMPGASPLHDESVSAMPLDLTAPRPAEQRVADTVLAVQVPLRFEIGWSRMRLSELCAIRPGEVLDLDVPVESAKVTILCGTDAIGTGQLVAVGDRLGVRVLGFARPGAAPAGEVPQEPARETPQPPRGDGPLAPSGEISHVSSGETSHTLADEIPGASTTAIQGAPADETRRAPAGARSRSPAPASVAPAPPSRSHASAAPAEERPR